MVRVDHVLLFVKSLKLYIWMYTQCIPAVIIIPGQHCWSSHCCYACFVGGDTKHKGYNSILQIYCHVVDEVKLMFLSSRHSIQGPVCRMFRLKQLEG